MEDRRLAGCLERDVDSAGRQPPDHGRSVLRGDGLSRTELERQAALRCHGIDGDDRVGTRENGPEERAEADPAQPEETDCGSGRDPRGVDDRTDAGEDGAAEQRRDCRRHLEGYDHRRTSVDHRVRGEGGDAQVVVDRHASATQTTTAAEQLAGRVRLHGRLTEVTESTAAVCAPSTAGEEHQHDTIALPNVTDPLAHQLDDAGRLVSQGHRRRTSTGSVDDGEVRMAHAGRVDADEQFACPGLRQVQFLEHE